MKQLAAITVLAAFFLPVSAVGQNSALSRVKTVFVILMENTDWEDIKDNPDASYINNTLLPQASYAEQDYTPPGLHPSLPNYLWLEAGDNFGVRDNDPPSVHRLSGDHLTGQLERAGIPWKVYLEGIDGTACPLDDDGLYAVRHDGAIYFTDVNGNVNPQDPYCIAHLRPYSELATDLSQGTVAKYNFITPDLCHDMHDCDIATGDAWLSAEIPTILNSSAFQDGGALFITWDEGTDSSDGPIGLILLSPLARGNGYSNQIPYTHSSLLRTIEEIFNLPLLRDAANANDLSDLFAP